MGNFTETCAEWFCRKTHSPTSHCWRVFQIHASAAKCLRVRGSSRNVGIFHFAGTVVRPLVKSSCAPKLKYVFTRVSKMRPNFRVYLLVFALPMVDVPEVFNVSKFMLFHISRALSWCSSTAVPRTVADLNRPSGTLVARVV